MRRKKASTARRLVLKQHVSSSRSLGTRWVAKNYSESLLLTSDRHRHCHHHKSTSHPFSTDTGSPQCRSYISRYNLPPLPTPTTRFLPVNDKFLSLFWYLRSWKDLLLALNRVIKNRITSMKKVVYELTYIQKCVIRNRISSIYILYDISKY